MGRKVDSKVVEVEDETSWMEADLTAGHLYKTLSSMVIKEETQLDLHRADRLLLGCTVMQTMINIRLVTWFILYRAI